MTPRVDPARIRELLQIGEEPGRLRIYPFILALLNLAVCAKFDQLVTDYAEGHYLHLFFLVELSGLVLLFVGMFLSLDRTIITKTLVLPLSSADRFIAVSLRALRSRSILAFASTTALFLAVLFRSRPLLALVAILLYLVAAALTIAATALVCLTAMRSSRAALVLIVTFVVALAGVLLASMMLDTASLASSVPVSSWLTRALLAAASGSGTAAAFWSGALGAALVAVCAAGIGTGRR
jgi:hypothetical protein